MKRSVSPLAPAAFQKIHLLLGLGIVAAGPVFAQGTLDFKNFGAPGLNAPVFLPDGVTPLGAGFSVFLLVGPASNSLALIDSTYFLTGSQAGYFDGPVETAAGVPGGTPVFVMLEFWESKLIPLPDPFQTRGPPYEWQWGASPEFSAVLGDPLSQPPTAPGTLSGLGATPIILAMPTLVVHPTDTNTLAFSWHVAPDQYALVANYILQQTSRLNQPSWTTITNVIDYAPVISRPSSTTFYRLAIQ